MQRSTFYTLPFYIHKTKITYRRIVLDSFPFFTWWCFRDSSASKTIFVFIHLKCQVNVKWNTDALLHVFWPAKCTILDGFEPAKCEIDQRINLLSNIYNYISCRNSFLEFPLLWMITTTTKKTRRFNSEVTNFLFMPIHNAHTIFFSYSCILFFQCFLLFFCFVLSCFRLLIQTKCQIKKIIRIRKGFEARINKNRFN